MKPKREKSSVDYSKGHKDSHCGNCAHFEPPHACELVKGAIDRSYWCKLWTKKKEQ